MSMWEVTRGNFGLIIAYLLPGFVALWSVSFFSEAVRAWLGTAPENAPTVGGFLYVTLASLAAGVTVSAICWAAVDTLHHLTGIRPPDWDFRTLHEKFDAFEGLVENHYRYYQFYANMLVSLILLYLAARFGGRVEPLPIGWIDAGLVVLCGVLLAGSRDALRKYYRRVEALLRAEGES